MDKCACVGSVKCFHETVMTTFKQEINGQYHDQKLQEGLEMDYKQNVFNLTSNQLIAKKKKKNPQTINMLLTIKSENIG